MNIVPFESYEINSEKKPEDILAAIAEKSEKWSLRNLFLSGNKPLTGDVKGSRFKVYRSIKYRNSFLPVAVVEVNSDSKGSITKITLRMHVFVTLFITLWLSMTLLAGIVFLYKSTGVLAFAPFGMFIFGYLLMQTCFWIEVPKIKSLLHQCFF